jgi:hypothetical protein
MTPNADSERVIEHGCMVFVEDYFIEDRGHVVEFHSDADRLTHGKCLCGTWYTVDSPDCRIALASWRRHVDSASPNASSGTP